MSLTCTSGARAPTPRARAPPGRRRRTRPNRGRSPGTAAPGSSSNRSRTVRPSSSSAKLPSWLWKPNRRPAALTRAEASPIRATTCSPRDDAGGGIQARIRRSSSQLRGAGTSYQLVEAVLDPRACACRPTPRDRGRRAVPAFGYRARRGRTARRPRPISATAWRILRGRVRSRAPSVYNASPSEQSSGDLSALAVRSGRAALLFVGTLGSHRARRSSAVSPGAADNVREPGARVAAWR